MAKKIIRKKIIRNMSVSNAHLRIDDHEKLCRIMQRETNNKMIDLKDQMKRLEKVVLYQIGMVVIGMATIIFELLIK
jgi:uncharacterized protein YpbB|tara:strand:+ start:270 stop:500 length:231 start_codon:yes stop_codon:yes gene_type:complete